MATLLGVIYDMGCLKMLKIRLKENIVRFSSSS